MLKGGNSRRAPLQGEQLIQGPGTCNRGISPSVPRDGTTIWIEKNLFEKETLGVVE